MSNLEQGNLKDKGTRMKIKLVFVIFCFVVGLHFNVETPRAEDAKLGERKGAGLFP